MAGRAGLQWASGHACPKGRVAESFETATVFMKMKCGNCGKLLFAEDPICPDCGAHVVARQISLIPAFLLGAVVLAVFIYLLAKNF